MTVSTTTNKISYAGQTSQDTFAYNFRVDEKSDMEVYFGDVLQPDGDWAITNLGNPAGGDVILDTPLVENTTVVLLRNIPLTQSTDYQPFDAFPAETHEQALDRLTFITQQLEEKITRNAQLKVDTALDSLPIEEPVAERLLIYNATGDEIENGPTAGEISSAESFADAAATSEANAATSEANAALETGYSAEWATKDEDSLISAAAGGNEVDDFSALHHSAKAASATFPPGTLMLFQQTAAPTGWTKETTHNDKALRVVSGAAGSAGTNPFSTVFGLQATDGHTLTVAQMPSHNHGSTGAHTHTVGFRDDGAVNGTKAIRGTNASDPANNTINTNNTGAHTHSGNGSGNSHSHNIELRVQYVDLIIASKD